MKYLVSFLAGAVTGAVGVYLYLNNKIDKKVEEGVSKEMESFLKTQESMWDRLVEEAVKEAEERQKKKEEYESFVSLYKEKNEPEPERSSIIDLKETEYTRYRGDAINIEEEEEEEITDEDVEILVEESRRRAAEGPYIVSEDDDECVTYDQEELTYYPEDNQLVDIYGQTVDSSDAYFGTVDWKKALSDKEKIIIRNPEDACDYIIYNDERYNK